MTVLLAGVFHDLDTLDTETLEGIRARARLEGATANPRQAHLAQALGDGIELLGAFHGTGTGEDDHLVGFAIGNVCLAHARISFMTLRIVAYISRMSSLYMGPSLKSSSRVKISSSRLGS